MHAPREWSEVRTTATKGLAQRLAAGAALSEADRARIEVVRRIEAWRLQRRSHRQIFTELGISEKSYYTFRATPLYAAAVAHLDRAAAFYEAEHGPTPELVTKEARARLARMIPLAQRRLELNLAAGIDAETGAVVDYKPADDAMKLVLESAGLTEPESAGRPSILIQQLVIQQRVQSIQADDARVHTLETTATPA